MSTSRSTSPPGLSDEELPDEERLLAEVIDGLDLDARHKGLLRARYVEYLAFLEKAAKRAMRWHYILRLLTVTGAALVPVLVGADLGTGSSSALSVVALVLSALVAVCSAVDHFLHLGDRWRHYRGVAEALKSEGWLFSQLAGQYSDQTHRSAYGQFVARVERMATTDVEAYLERVVAERPENRSSDQGVAH